MNATDIEEYISLDAKMNFPGLTPSELHRHKLLERLLFSRKIDYKEPTKTMPQHRAVYPDIKR